MKIDTGGQSYNVVGQGQGTYNTVGASLGIASFLGMGANNGCGNGILGGLFGGNCGNNNCCVSQREGALALALSEARSKEQALELARQEDAKIADVLKQTNDGLIQVANGVSRNDVRLACLEKDVAFLQRESERNLAEAKSYTDMKVEHEAQLRKAGDDNIAAWTQTELNKKIDGTMKLDGGSVSWNGCRPVLQSCPCGSEQSPYFINSSTADVTAIANAVLAAIKASQPTA